MDDARFPRPHPRYGRQGLYQKHVDARLKGRYRLSLRRLPAKDVLAYAPNRVTRLWRRHFR